MVSRFGTVAEPGPTRALSHKVKPAGHHAVVFPQDGEISRRLVNRPRHEHARVAPTRRALKHFRDKGSGVVDGRDVLDQSVHPLRAPAFCEPVPEHRGRVHQHDRRRSEDPRVPRPSGTLARRTIRRDIAEVRLHAPDAVSEETVHVRIAAVKPRGFPHIGIDGDGSERCGGKIGIGFDLRVPEAEDREIRVPDVAPFPADTGELLRDPSVFVPRTGLEIRLSEVTVFVEGLPVPQLDPLSCFRVFDPDFGIACEVLSEVDHLGSVRRGEEPPREPFMLPDGQASGAYEVLIAERPHHNAVPSGDPIPARVVFLSKLQIVQPRRPLLRSLPALIADTDGLSHYLELAEKREIPAVVFGQTVHADTPTVPPVSEGHLQLVFAFAEQVGDVVNLITKTFCIICGPGREDFLSDPHTVDPCNIESVTGDIETRAFCF